MIFKRFKSKKITDFAKGQDCLIMSPVCNRDSKTVVACHIPAKFMSGTATKNSDFCIVFGCSSCHHWIDVTERGTEKASHYILNAFMMTLHILHENGYSTYKQ